MRGMGGSVLLGLRELERFRQRTTLISWDIWVAAGRSFVNVAMQVTRSITRGGG